MLKGVSALARVQYINEVKSLEVGHSRVYNVTIELGKSIKLIVDRIISDMVYLDYAVEVDDEKTTVTRLADRPLLTRARGPKPKYDFTRMAIGEEIVIEQDINMHVSVRLAVRRAIDQKGLNIVAASSGRTISVKRLEPGATLETVRGYGIPEIEPGAQLAITLTDDLTINVVRRVASYYSVVLGTRFSVALRDGVATITRAGGGDRRAAARAPEPIIDVEEQKRLAAEVLARAKQLQDEEF